MQKSQTFICFMKFQYPFSTLDRLKYTARLKYYLNYFPTNNSKNSKFSFNYISSIVLLIIFVQNINWMKSEIIKTFEIPLNFYYHIILQNSDINLNFLAFFFSSLYRLCFLDRSQDMNIWLHFKRLDFLLLLHPFRHSEYNIH